MGSSVSFHCAPPLLRMVDLRLFVFPWLDLPCILPLPVCTALCAQHANVVSVVFPVVAAEIFCFPSCAESDAVVVPARDTGSNVSSGQAVNWMASKPKLRQPSCHRCARVRSRESLQSEASLSNQQWQRHGHTRHSGWIECFQRNGR